MLGGRQMVVKSDLVFDLTSERRSKTPRTIAAIEKTPSQGLILLGRSVINPEALFQILRQRRQPDSRAPGVHILLVLDRVELHELVFLIEPELRTVNLFL